MGNELLQSKPDPSRFADEPETMALLSWTDIYSIPAAEVEVFRLKALKNRFNGLVDRVGVLKNLAGEQGIHEINRIEDGAPLAFGQAVHFCVGAKLARAELVKAIGAVLERTSELWLDETEPLPQFVIRIPVRGVDRLPVSFKKAA